MTGIFYFSSTGNSLYIAKQIKNELSGEIHYIPNYQADASEFQRIIVVSPVYSWGLPVHVYDFLGIIDKKLRVDIVLNYGGMLGGADRFTYELAKQNGLNICSIYTVKMPENYTLSFSVPKFYMRSILKKAPQAVATIITGLKNREVQIPVQGKTKHEKYYQNKKNWHLIAKDFTVTDDCVKCGKCVNICPSKNISLMNEKIVFSDQCVACLGCYHRCPKKAIRYKSKAKKDRYLNPNIIESEIGQSIK